MYVEKLSRNEKMYFDDLIYDSRHKTDGLLLIRISRQNIVTLNIVLK